MTKYHDWEIYEKEENQLLSDMIEDIGEAVKKRLKKNLCRITMETLIKNWLNKNSKKIPKIKDKNTKWERPYTKDMANNYLLVRVYSM